MQVKDILHHKGSDVIALLPETMVTGAAMLLAQDTIGAAVVADPENEILGIISERDISRGLAENGERILEMRVEDLMVRSVVTCDSDTSVDDALAIMRANRIRHLPVVEGDNRLVGLISMRDMMENHLDEADTRNEDLPRTHSIASTG